MVGESVYDGGYFLVNAVINNLLESDPNNAPKGTIPFIIPEASPGVKGMW